MAKTTRLFLTSLLLAVGLVWAIFFQFPDKQLHLIFCDVGQGDATLITLNSTQILIDGGPNNQVLACLEKYLPFWDRQIEMVVLTHPEADHLTGLIEIIKRYDINQFVINSLVNDSAAFWEFRQAVLDEGAPVYSPQAGDELHLGPIAFKVYWAVSDSAFVYEPGSNRNKVLGASTIHDDFNETSVVGMLSYGTFDTLLTGDIGFDTEKKLAFGELPPVEILKVAHHGSKHSSNEEFLHKVDPDLAIISVGKNSFGHPTEEVLERLTNLGAKVLRTDLNAYIEVISDGRTWVVK